MARRTTITVNVDRHTNRPRNAAARALRSAVYRPRVSKNPKAYSRKGKKTAPVQGDDLD